MRRGSVSTKIVSGCVKYPPLLCLLLQLAAKLLPGLVVSQPSTQAFSSRSHDLARNFVTSPDGIPGTSFGDVTTFRTKSSRVSGRRTPGY